MHSMEASANISVTNIVFSMNRATNSIVFVDNT